MFSLEGKRILITGASSGIGRQIAISLADCGASLTLVGRNMARLNDVLFLLHGDNHKGYEVDITNSDALINFITGIADSFDGIVFNAGMVEYIPAKFINAEKIRRIFDVNFNANVLLSQQLIKQKRINKNGSLVFISSISSKLGVAGTALYASSKAALNAYSKVLATELANQGIRSNCICPGIVKTSVIDRLNQILTESAMEEAEKDYPLGYNEPVDVAALAIYLLSNASRRMTGSDLIIDGGYSLT